MNKIITEISATDNVSSVVAKISRDVSAFAQDTGEAVRRIAQATEGASGVLGKIAQNTRTSWAELATGAASMMNIAQSVVGKFGEAWRSAVAIGDASQRLSPLVGGLDRSRALAEALRNEAANGTESFEKLAGVAGRLASVFKSTESIRRWTSAFHNISAGTGLDVNELVGNFVRSRASGRFEAGFLDMFAQKGVNIYEPLAKELKMSEAELRKAAKTGELAFSDVERAILACAEGTGVFAGQAEAMSNTAGGAAKTLGAQWEILVAKFAEPIAEALTPLMQRMSASMVKMQPLAAAVGSAVSNVGGALVSAFENLPKTLGIATAAWAMFNARVRASFLWIVSGKWFAPVIQSARSAIVAFRAFGAAARAQYGSVVSFSGAVLRLDKTALSLCRSLAVSFPAAIRAAKAAVVSTLIGAVFVALGEAIAYVYNKIAEGRELKDRVNGLTSAVKDLDSAFAETDAAGVRRVENEKLAESMQLLEEVAQDAGVALGEVEEMERKFIAGTFNTDDADNGEAFKRIFEMRAEIRKKAAAAYVAAVERETEKRKAAERKAREEEIAEMRKNIADVRAELEKRKLELARQTAESIPAKIKIELDLVGRETVESLDWFIESYGRFATLTDEQKRKFEQLLAAREKIAAIEASTESARASLREKVALMQAELAGNEKLLALKEKLHEAEIRAQFIKAGASAEQAEEGVRRYRELERAVEAKRDAEKRAEEEAKANETVGRESEELAILRAKISGNDALAASLERERAIREKIASLTAQGVSEEKARALATERVALEAAKNGVENGGNATAGAANVPAARDEVERRLLSAAYRTARASGLGHDDAVSDALLRVRGGGSAGNGSVVPAAAESVLSVVSDIREHTRGILDVLRGGFNPQKLLVNPILS